MKQQIHLRLLVTDYCSQKCNHCIFSRKFSQDENFLELKKVDQLCTSLQQLKSFGDIYLTVTGGEPLEHPQIEQLLEKLHQTNATTHIRLATNLLPVLDDSYSEEKLFKALDFIDEVIVSTETTSKSYSELRNADRRDEVMDYLDDHLREKLREKKVVLSTNLLISKSTIQYLAPENVNVLFEDFDFIRIIRFFSDGSSHLPNEAIDNQIWETLTAVNSDNQRMVFLDEKQMREKSPCYIDITPTTQKLYIKNDVLRSKIETALITK